MELFLVLGTWALVAVTLWVAYQQSRAFRKDLKIKLQLQFADRFDNPQLVTERASLAKHLLETAPREQISEAVMDFFEDLGMFLDQGYLDEALIWKTFGFYAVRWWSACRDYILEERRLHTDQTLFADFEALAKRMRSRDIGAEISEPSSENIRTFLMDES